MASRSVTAATSSDRARTLPPLGRAFFDRPTARVARDLLGAYLVRHGPGAPRVAQLVETEAYVGRDPANHAFFGPTPRNLAMFGPPGTLYVYRIHQVHCANAVTRPGEAVLLRAARPVEGLDASLSGPGRLCRGFGLTRRDNGLDLTKGEVTLVGGPAVRGVVRAPRVGIQKARERPLRFVVAGEPSVSSPRPPGWRRRPT